MSDYNKRFKKPPHTVSWGERSYPNFAIGTYLRTIEELNQLFRFYPYDHLLIDTAYKYGNELDVAQSIVLSGYPRENVSFIGKIGYSQQNGTKSVREELEGTLQRLNIRTLDTYLIHSPRYEDFCDTWAQLILLRDEGLINSIGVSNFSIKELDKIHKHSGEYPSVVQIVYCPILESANGQEEIIHYCKSKRIQVQAAMPFGGAANTKNVTAEQRKVILQSLHSKDIVSVFSTSNVSHLIHNLNILEEI